jgi:hypothetical protein
MTLDELIALLQGIKEKHGGNILIGVMSDEGTYWLLKKEDVKLEENSQFEFFNNETKKVEWRDSNPGIVF